MMKRLTLILLPCQLAIIATCMLGRQKTVSCSYGWCALNYHNAWRPEVEILWSRKKLWGQPFDFEDETVLLQGQNNFHRVYPLPPFLFLLSAEPS